jgi:hypothetical protein
VFIVARQRRKLARYRIWRFDVQIVDTLNRAQPIAPTIIFPLSDEINRTALGLNNTGLLTAGDRICAP